MKKLRNEKGAITMITLLTILFMVSFLMTSYTLIANKVKTQKEILAETKAIYEPKSTMEEIYNSFTTIDNIIPIYTVEQLLSIGNDQKININRKIYTFGNDENTTYLLKNDLEFNAKELKLETDWVPPYEDTNFIANFDWSGHTIEVTTLNEEVIIYDGKYLVTTTRYSPITLNNAIKSDLVDYKIFGNSVQNGTPTPDTPIEVESVGDKSKNLINNVRSTQTINGITFTVNEDKSITLNGTNTGNDNTIYNIISNVNYVTQNIVLEENSTYTLSGKTSLPSGVYLQTHGNVNGSAQYKTFSSNPTTFTTVESSSWSCYLRVDVGVTVDNLTIYPQLEEGSTATNYAPYGKYKIPIKVSNGTSETTTNIYLDEPLRKVGDIADYIDFETKKVERNVKKIVLNGSETWYKFSDLNVYHTSNDELKFDKNIYCLSNKYKGQISASGGTYNSGNIWLQSTSSYPRIYIANDNYTTVEDFKIYLNSNNVTGYFPLVKSDPEPIELPNIQLYRGINTITVDTEIQPSNVSVTYNAKQ